MLVYICNTMRKFIFLPLTNKSCMGSDLQEKMILYITVVDMPATVTEGDHFLLSGT